MQRLRVYDVRTSRLPSAIGLCSADINGVCGYLNSAERRLIMAKEAGDEGWWGTWAEIAFTTTQLTPYITMPRNVARVEAVALCDQPIDLHNQFYEYLRFGNGRLPKIFSEECHKRAEVFTRNNAPGFVDITGGAKYIVVYLTDVQDVGKRVLVQGRDASGATIYSQDGQQPTSGIFTDLQSPSVTVANDSGVPVQYSAITGYQKDITAGPVQFFAMDPVTGVQTLLHTMEPSETTGWYRRYYFHGLPYDCCTLQGPFSACPASVPAGQLQLTAICKLEPIPVRYDTDYLLLQNLEALIEECQAIRYGDMDVANAKAFEARHHSKAIGLLNGELAHYLGINDPAVEFAPFGTAKFERVNLGMI